MRLKSLRRVFFAGHSPDLMLKEFLGEFRPVGRRNVLFADRRLERSAQGFKIKG